MVYSGNGGNTGKDVGLQYTRVNETRQQTGSIKSDAVDGDSLIMCRGWEFWEMLQDFARCADRSKGWEQALTRSAATCVGVWLGHEGES